MKHDPGFLKLRKIRAAQKIAKTAASSANRTYLPSDGLMLNIADADYLNFDGKTTDGGRRHR
jgi:prohibitin 2